MLVQCFCVKTLISSSDFGRSSASKNNQHQILNQTLFIKNAPLLVSAGLFFSLGGSSIISIKKKITLSQNQTVKIDLLFATATKFSTGISDKFSGKLLSCDRLKINNCLFQFHHIRYKNLTAWSRTFDNRNLIQPLYLFYSKTIFIFDFTEFKQKTYL